MFRPHVYDTDPRTRQYIVPVRVVRTTGEVAGAENLLQARPPQISSPPSGSGTPFTGFGSTSTETYAFPSCE